MLSYVYEAQGNHKKALVLQREYEILKDSLLDQQKAKDINGLEIKYRTTEKDKDLTAGNLLIAQQKAKLQRRNMWMRIGGLGILFLASSSFFIWRNLRHRQNALRIQLNVMEQQQEIQLLKASIQGEEQERMRIGKELHDGIGGLFSAVKLQIGSVRLKHQDIAEEEDLKKAITLVDEATTEVRKVAHNLIPEILLKGGISSAVQQFCNRISTFSGPDIKVQLYGRIPRLEMNLELSVYRIIQELVNNALKHAQASEIMVQLNWTEHHFHITVQDNGVGMNIKKNKALSLTILCQELRLW